MKIKAGGLLFSVVHEPLDATMNGLFGGDPDVNASFVAGLATYEIDGRPVTEQEWRRRYAEACQQDAEGR